MKNNKSIGIDIGSSAYKVAAFEDGKPEVINTIPTHGLDLDAVDLMTERIRHLRETTGIEHGTQAVITLPAACSFKTRQRITEANRLAGIDVIRIIPAAISAGLSHIYAAKLRDELHTIIVYALRDDNSFESAVLTTEVGVCEVISTNGFYFDEQSITPSLVEQTIERCEQTIAEAEIQPSEVDVVVFTGEHAQEPVVQQVLNTLFPAARKSSADIALGAAIYAEKLCNGIDSALLLHATQHDFGMKIDGIFDPVVPKNTTIPRRYGRYGLTKYAQDQDPVNIVILKNGYEEIGQLTLSNLSDEVLIDVEFSVNADDSLEVSAYETGSKEKESVIISYNSEIYIPAPEFDNRGLRTPKTFKETLDHEIPLWKAAAIIARYFF